MKFDFESLTAEPLIYMLMHSGVFVCVLGGIFFIVGLVFGHATWGRYKRQTKALLKEAEAMKGEIADLKRKIAEHTVKSGPVIAMATETIHMPKKEAVAAAPAASPEAAPVAAPVPTPVAAVAAPVEAPAPPKLNLIRPKVPVQPTPPPAAEAPAPPPVAAGASTGPLPPNPWVAALPPEKHVSPLAAIIATHPHTKDEESKAEGGAVADAIAIPSELSVAPLPEIDLHAAPEIVKPELLSKPEPEIKPEEDPRLGLVYKTRPEKVDDLTALHGIAQVLQQRLNELGIYTYSQIAAWNEEQVREFSSRLAFKDRIHREHWVEQAAKLAAGGRKAA